MLTPEIIAPINTLMDLSAIKKTQCKNIYIYHSIFLKKSNQKKLLELIKKARKLELNLYINFKNNIKESDITKIKQFIDFIKEEKIKGFIVNDIGLLQIIKNLNFKKEIIIDSGLNIHNLTSAEFINEIYPTQNINITEEIYRKNIEKIKKYTNYKLSIDANNFPWIAQDILQNNLVDKIIIKAKFNKPEELLEGILSLTNILENPEQHHEQRLPFKNIGNSLYKSDHFSGEFQNERGRAFKFSGNIQQFKWSYKKFYRPKYKNPPSHKNIPTLGLRLNSLEQFKELKNYIKKHKHNPVSFVEYGEILSTTDLSKFSFNKLISKVKKHCTEMQIKLKLSTPKTLIERDFDRVYEYTKSNITEKPYPDSIIINNLGYLWNTINDKEINIPIDLGHKFNIKNSDSILLLNSYHQIQTVDLSNFSEIENLKMCIENIQNEIPFRQLTIAGNIRIPSSGLCPLNKDSAILTRLSCSAPCHNGNYSLQDKAIKKHFPIAVDGFCRMHLFKDKILDLFKHIELFEEIGINAFIIDFSSLPAKFVPILLNRYIDALNNKDYEPDPYYLTDEYGIRKYLTKK